MRHDLQSTNGGNREVHNIYELNFSLQARGFQSPSPSPLPPLCLSPFFFYFFATPIILLFSLCPSSIGFLQPYGRVEETRKEANKRVHMERTSLHENARERCWHHCCWSCDMHWVSSNHFRFQNVSRVICGACLYPSQ